MSRSMKELFAGGRNTPAAGSQHRRGRSLTTVSRDTDENLDLFSKNRRSLSVTSSDESDVSLKLGRLSAGPVKLVRSGLDDLLSSPDGGKHDYDWLLTPPGTPLFASSDGSEPRHQVLGAPRNNSFARTASTTKTSRLSVTQTESNHSSRPVRSSSVTRSAVSATQYNTYSNKSPSILNTSSASVSSYVRPSSPITRTPSTARPSTPPSRSVSSRSTTPSRTRPSSISSSTEKTRPSPTSRPSTPTSRPTITANLSSPASRPNSRPSTPRRISTPSSSPVASLSVAVGRLSSNGRTPAPSSRPNSPSPRVRSPSQPVILPDPLDIPPNLRTSLPERPLSAGRSRPGLATTTVKGNTETPSSGNLPRRQPSPTITRGRLVEQSGRSPGKTNGHAVAPPIAELAMRKPVKTPTSVAAADSTGFGRTISKKSLDMAIRHMDIRNGTGGNRSGTTLFPQSIRSSAPKTQIVHASSNAPSSVMTNGNLHIYTNGIITENGNYINTSQENGHGEQNGRFSSKLNHIDIYESSRYDTILFKEDTKNTNWLHSIDDKSDQGLSFDYGFEYLPEPFSPL